LNDEGKRLLKIIGHSAIKMADLIDCLLKFSRLGRKEVIKVTIDMNFLIAEIVEGFETVQVNKDLRWKVGELLPAKGDKELLRQVLINLISNAIKYSSKREQPEIEIGCQIKNTEVTYYVKDNGAGFDMNHKDKLFGVFQRLHTESEFEGIGIGLAIVQRIVTRHGGTIWPEGEVDKGAAFYFSLPK
jgi:two-component system, sensor histidine kinase and response regulator